MKHLLKSCVLFILIATVSALYANGCGGGGDDTTVPPGDQNGDDGGGGGGSGDGDDARTFIVPTTPYEMADLAAAEYIKVMTAPAISLISILGTDRLADISASIAPLFDLSDIVITQSDKPDFVSCHCEAKPGSCDDVWLDPNCNVFFTPLDTDGNGHTSYGDPSCVQWLEASIMGFPAIIWPFDEAPTGTIPPYNDAPIMYAALDAMGAYDFTSGDSAFSATWRPSNVPFGECGAWREGLQFEIEADLDALETAFLAFSGSDVRFILIIGIFPDDDGFHAFSVELRDRGDAGIGMKLPAAAAEVVEEGIDEQLFELNAQGKLSFDTSGVTDVVMSKFFMDISWKGFELECQMDEQFFDGETRCEERNTSFVPEICDNGVDDDGDGLVDCDDEEVLPEDCCENNGNAPGCVDCSDPSAWSNCDFFAACGGEETICFDGFDDDGDGAIDCDDTDCTSHPCCYQSICTPVGCSAPELCGYENCENTINDDEDWHIDCQDDDCAWRSICQTDIMEEQNCIDDGISNDPDEWEACCTDDLDNDLDGYKNCIDLDCWNIFKNDICNEAQCDTNGNEIRGEPEDNCCGNGIDDEEDGPYDCEDSDCASTEACLGASESDNCDDGLDNDSDFMIDCEDQEDCPFWSSPACERWMFCRNGQDDDSDGLIDCADNDGPEDCTGQMNCLCTNCSDDDTDGLIDCEDPPLHVMNVGIENCSHERACICFDGIDNDADGKIDMADSDGLEECLLNGQFEYACAPAAECPSIQCADSCNNGTDDDNDGVADCDDPQCAEDPSCATGGPSCSDFVCTYADGVISNFEEVFELPETGLSPTCYDLGCGTNPDQVNENLGCIDGLNVCSTYDRCPDRQGCSGMLLFITWMIAPDPPPADTHEACALVGDDWVPNERRACSGTECCVDCPLDPNCTYNVCGDGRDTDRDGLTDCADPDCNGVPPCP